MTRRFTVCAGVFCGAVLYFTVWETSHRRWTSHEASWPLPDFGGRHNSVPSPRRWLGIGELVPQVVVDPSRQYEAETFAAIKRVYHCLANYEDCAERPEGNVVIVAYEHFWRTTSGNTGGEIIWCESLLTAFKGLGYSVLTATNVDMALFLYRLFPDLVRVVIMQVRFLPNLNSNFVATCFNDRFCIRSAKNPTVPTPMGHIQRYALTPPFNITNPAQLRYAISHHCTKTPVIAPENRTNQAFILAKESSYFYDDQDKLAFPLDAYTTITRQTGIRVVTVAKETIGQPIPGGVEKRGQLTREDFYEELSSSKILIGIGRPFLSPSPFDALCLGVPFVNPYNATRIKSMDEIRSGDIWNPFSLQHGALAELRPPFVYHVPMGNTSALVAAVREADQNPIRGRGLPQEMWMESLMERVKELVEVTDWEERAREEKLL
ncbi:hypothetical protein FRB96_007465 [Tulasnella sp. 330]|nr:hypothetical protein FRB96_007465 [Tulasnella sp. 330]